jgi:hypothetical protein
VACLAADNADDKGERLRYRAAIQNFVGYWTLHWNDVHIYPARFEPAHDGGFVVTP